jgi:subtilase family serine protease
MSSSKSTIKPTPVVNMHKPLFTIQKNVSNSFIQPNLYTKIQTEAESNTSIARRISPMAHGQTGGSENTKQNQTQSTPVKATILPIQPPFYPIHLQQVYQLSGKNTGAGQLIGIVCAYGYPNAYSDLYAFCTQFNLPKPNNVNTVQKLMATPASNTFNFMVYQMSTPIQNDPEWSVEQALDTQWAHVSAPTAPILLVQAKSATTTDLFAGIQYAVNAGASVISLSWGMPEGSYARNASYQQIFNKPNTTFIASSGDSVGVYYPSVSPYIVSAGGTTLTINSSTVGTTTTFVRGTEKVWYNSISDAEGCGVSKYLAIPSYQAGFTTSKSARTVPDIVSVADPNSGVLVYNSFYSKTTRWYQIGGTSLSSPFMAGIIASANAARVVKKKTRFSSTTLLQALYQLLKSGNSSNYSKSMYDVTTGTNNGYTTKAGYDVPSGVGAPNGDALIDYLVNY